MRLLQAAIAGTLALGAIASAPQEAKAQFYDYFINRAATPGYCERNPDHCEPPSYWDYANDRPATLGFCERNPANCDPSASRYQRYRR
jgi:hypothetical protein